MEFRTISKNELKELWRFHKDYVDKNAKLKDIVRVYSRHPNLFVGCFNKNRLIGYAFLDKHNNIYFIRGIAVKQRYWRKGIGSRLLKQIETQAREEGIKKITVGVAPIEWVEKFYMKNGYKPYLFLVKMKDKTSKKIYIRTHKYNPNQRGKIKEKFGASEVIYIMKKSITKKEKGR